MAATSHSSSSEISPTTATRMIPASWPEIRLKQVSVGWALPQPAPLRSEALASSWMLQLTFSLHNFWRKSKAPGSWLVALRNQQVLGTEAGELLGVRCSSTGSSTGGLWPVVFTQTSAEPLLESSRRVPILRTAVGHG